LQSRAWHWSRQNTTFQRSPSHNTSLNLYINDTQPPSLSNAGPTLRLYVVRHGQTKWNVQGLLQGHSNTKLTAKGVADSLATGRELRNVTFKKIYCSDLARARHTLQLLGLEGEYDERLRGRDYALFTGKHFVTYQTSKNPSTVESNQQMTHRWREFFSKMISDITPTHSAHDKTYNILLVTHGGMVRIIAADLQRFSKRAVTVQKSRTLNTSISIFDLVLREEGIVSCDFVSIFGSKHLENSYS